MFSPYAAKKLYWLPDIENAYGLKIEAIVEMRSVNGIRADGRNYIVKNLGSSVAVKRLHALARALEQIYRQGGPVCPILRTNHGRFYTRSQENVYILQPWIKGRHVDFTKQNELKAALQAIGRFHSKPVVLANEYARELEIPSLYEKYAIRLQRCQRTLHNHSQLWSQVLDSALWEAMQERAKDSIQSMKEKLIDHRAALLSKSFCHRDLAPHNLMYRSTQKITLIDFDLAGFDVSMHDVYQVMNHTMYLHGWHARDILTILDTYDACAGMSSQDRKLLYDLMTFPSLLIREIQDLHKSWKAGRIKDPEKIKMRIRWVQEIEYAKLQWIEKNRNELFSV
ncbi:phosphotransferase [Fodinisporobacter ferrooxydans]|uniref:Phosphotransferase n=1 Tax=Fodinisporobacter ferrooxydans TaxID=2901836 RepID=A0ABY4CQE9_9BACL|nr:phosphotransferase [Alicyclobacillaceae bacterium MYW30-H2]